MKNLKEMREKSAEYDLAKEDFVFDAGGFWWDDEMSVRTRQIPLNRSEPINMKMNDWALRQACRKHAIPYSYVDRCPDHLASTNLNWWRMQTDRRFMLRTYGDTIRGYLSNRYHPISNTWLLDTVIEMMEDVPYELLQATLTPDFMHTKILVADTVGGNVAVGVYINNGEVGDYKIRVHPMVMVTECTNSIIFAEGFEHFHVNITESTLRVSVKEALGEALQKSPEYIEKMMKAEEKKVPNISLVVENMCKQYNLSQAVHDDILIGTHGHETVLGLANGLSYAAQKVSDSRTRIDMEITAGRAITYSESLMYLQPVVVSEPEE